MPGALLPGLLLSGWLALDTPRPETAARGAPPANPASAPGASAARFVTRAQARLDAGRLALDIEADGALDEARLSSKVGSGYLYVYVEGLRARSDNRAWPARAPDELDVQAHRHPGRVEIKVALPAGCAGPVRLRLATAVRVGAELSCAGAPAPGARSSAVASVTAQPGPGRETRAQEPGAEAGRAEQAAAVAPETAPARALPEAARAPRDRAAAERPAPAGSALASTPAGGAATLAGTVAGALAMLVGGWLLARRLRGPRAPRDHRPAVSEATPGAHARAPDATAKPCDGPAPEPGPAATLPEARAPEPGPAATLPEARAPEPGPAATLPEARAPEPGPAATLPEARAPEPGPAATLPEARAPELAVGPTPAPAPPAAAGPASGRRAELERRLIASLFGAQAAARHLPDSRPPQSR